WLLQELERRRSAGARGSLRVIAIGNDENDRSLLEAAHRAFVIRNPESGAHPDLAGIPGAVVLDAEGPAGWLEMIERLAHLNSASSGVVSTGIPISARERE